MEILFIVLGSVVFYLIGYAIGAVKNTPELPNCCQTCLRYHDGFHYQHLSCYGKCCDHFGCESLRRELSQARSEADYYKRQSERMVEGNRQMFCDVLKRPMDEVWFKTVGNKDRAAEKLKEAMKTLKELEKELA